MDKLLSLCMIVKDEEQTLGRCLESVQGLVDEIIIVDTGSTDSTKDIAARFGAKISDFVWTKDFAAARNESLSKATGTWILVLDADEYVQKEQHSKLKQFLLGIDSTIPRYLILPIMNIFGENESNMKGLLESSGPRIFSNFNGIYYTKPIHEQLTIDSGDFHQDSFAFTIYHSGYTDETVTRKEKSKRNLEIFEKMDLDTEKNDPYHFFTLANEYAKTGDHNKAIDYYQRAYKQSDPNLNWIPICMDYLINNYFIVEDYSKAFELIQTGLQRWGQFSDYYAYTGYIYNKFGFDDLAKENYLAAIQIGEEAGSSGKQTTLVKPHLSIVYPSRYLAQIYLKENNLAQAVFYFTKVLNSTPRDTAVLYKLIQVLSKSESAESMITFFEKLYPSQHQANLSLMFQISVLAASTDLAKYYYQRIERLDIALEKEQLLNYALLTHDISLFNQILDSIGDTPDSKSPVYKFLLVAIATWRLPEYIKRFNIQLEHSLYKITQSILAVFNGADPVAITDEDSASFTELLVKLFEVQSFEAFDLLMTHLSNPDIINRVADHFYSIQQLDLAIDYYSILLKEDLLHATGYENLSYLHFNQGDIENGLAFLERALGLQPNNMALYALYSKHAANDSKKKAYNQQFIDNFPRYKDLPFIRSIKL
ncbi:tetratricopeptide repeat-containing glycosyltransferase family 2 protein [Paenibacillus aestuarii]|uniref:Glycosyltransferase n=1 Tax=Paenibacillus aestuarii TaxID=516965 RepID=A0ABW0K6A7_9BACL|nr:glycosyltransferase [Paenibacillus aestuarii]